jgi:Ca2+-binding EF-hand superfamily protein
VTDARGAVQAARKAKDTRRRAARQTSNVFAMFDQKQIAEFKEAFSMIDQNKDGFIDKQDLKDILADLSTPGPACRHHSGKRKR